MNRWKAILRYGLVFVLGLALGAFGSHLVIKHRFARGMHNRPVAMRQMLMRHLTSQLKLNDLQQVEIERIVENKLKALSDLHAKQQPEIQAIFRDARAEMKTHLNPDQQQKLDLVMDRMRNRWQMHPGPPPMLGRHGERRPPMERDELQRRQGLGDNLDDPHGQ